MFEGVYRPGNRLSHYEAKALCEQAEILQKALVARPNKMLPAPEPRSIAGKTPKPYVGKSTKAFFAEKLEALRTQGIGTVASTWRDHAPKVQGEEYEPVHQPTPRRKVTKIVKVFVPEKLCMRCQDEGFVSSFCRRVRHPHDPNCHASYYQVHTWHARVRNGRPLGEQRREALDFDREAEELSTISMHRGSRRIFGRNGGRKPRQAYRPVRLVNLGT